jgi:hypothetical protein
VPVAKTAPAETKPKAAPAPGATTVEAPAWRERRIPGWLVALVGTALAVGYGAGVEKMRFGPPLVMLGLGGMTLALCGLALWRVIDPLTRPDGGAALQPRAPQRLRELEREKFVVLKAIKEVELDHQMRKIADADYRDMIERYRARAMRLIGEIEAGDNFRELIERELKDRLAAESAAAEAEAPEGDAPPAAPGVCPACATKNDEDAQFCKKCGAKIEQR